MIFPHAPRMYFLTHFSNLFVGIFILQFWMQKFFSVPLLALFHRKYEQIGANKSLLDNSS